QPRIEVARSESRHGTQARRYTAAARRLGARSRDDARPVQDAEGRHAGESGARTVVPDGYRSERGARASASADAASLAAALRGSEADRRIQSAAEGAPNAL